MSLEAYLSLTDEDIQYLISTGLGASPNNPFYGTAMKEPRSTKADAYEEPHDNSMDYAADSDEIEVNQSINLDNIDHTVDLDSLPDQDTLD